MDSPSTILIIDDTEAARYAMGRQLLREGYTVWEAATGQEGLALAIERQPHLIILDINLPDTVGYDVCRALKSTERTASIPVLQVSAVFQSSGYKSKGFDSGADGFLAKPVEPEELLAHIRALLRMRQAEVAARESEAKLRAMFRSLAEGVVFINGQAVVEQANDAVERLLGRSLQQLRESGIAMLRSDGTPLPPDQQPPIVALRTGQPVPSMEMETSKPDGAVACVLVSAQPVHNEHGQVLGAVASFFDITDRKRAEDQLRRNHDTFYHLIQNNPFGIYVVDADFRLRQVSAGSQKVFSNVRPLIGRDFAEVLRCIWSEPFASEAIARFRHTLETGEPYSEPSTVERRRDNAEVEAYDWRIERIILPDGRFGVVCYFYDLSERKQMEQLLQNAKEQLRQHAEDLEETVHERTAKLRETVADLEQFSYSLAHDLRAPLRSMTSFSTLLLQEHQDKLAGESLDYLRRIASGAQRMDELIRDVLSYTQVARADISLAPVDLDRLVHEIVNQYPHLQPDQADITVVSPLLAVQGNLALITQCVSNLLGNAVKFVAAGVKPKVRVWTELRADRVRIFIQDNGVGVEPHQLERIWRIFERGHNLQNYPGTGIGLSVVKRAAERMEGSVGVQSEPGKGSTFWFELGRA